MPEVRIQAEGTMRWVQQSGSGRTWATASAPQSGLYGFVQSFSFTSAQTVTTIMERGLPDHQKVTMKAPIDVSVEFLWTGSAAGQQAPATGSGATVPMLALELRASAGDMAGSPSAWYYQFHGAALQSIAFTEAAEGNRISVQFRALAMVGPTASGYLS